MFWAVTAASRSSIGNKAMRFGSQTMAQAAYDLVTHRELFDAVREEFVRRTAGLGDYKSHLPLPVGHFDPLTYEKERQEGGCR